MSERYFVTSTGTEIGKTVVSSLLVNLLADDYDQVGYWKPVASGCAESDYGYRSPDEVEILNRTDLTPENVTSSLRFDAPLSPDKAAEKENRSIDVDELLADWQQLKSRYEALVVEGIGGVAVPFGPEYDVSDLTGDLDIPVLLVVSSHLGTISHTRTAVDFLPGDHSPAGILLTPETGTSIEPLNRDHLRDFFPDRTIDLLPHIDDNKQTALEVMRQFRTIR